MADLLPNKEIITVSIDDIELDTSNPRLPSTIDKSDENEILEWMLANASLIELMQSIVQNGYFKGEPVLLVKSKSKKAKYTVIEGNRRVSAVKILNNPKVVSRRESAINEVIENASVIIPTTLPAIIFNDEKETIDYLGYRHITGVKQWNPLAKARYLNKLFLSKKDIKDIDERYRVIAKIIGSKASYVKRMHTTYKVFDFADSNDFFGIDGVNEDTIEFSNLNDALTKFSHISKYVNIDFEKKDPIKNINEHNLRNIFEWMFYRHPTSLKSRVGEVRNLPKLNAVLNSKNVYARKAFIEDDASIEKAYNLTDEPSAVFTKSLIEALDKIQTAQELFYTIDMPKLEDAKIARQISDFSHDFYRAISQKVDRFGND